MVVVDVKGFQFYMDGKVKSNLDYVKDRVLNYNNMMVCIIDGRPGAGKSTLAAQAAYYCTDGNLSIEDETFTIDQTTSMLKKQTPGKAVIIDEAFDQMNKRTANTTMNMLTISLLQRMRSKRIFIFIVLPYIYDLDKNVILGLCDTFIHCYRRPFGPRGQYKVYDEDRLRRLYLVCRQTYNYPDKVSQPNFYGKFSKKFPLDYNEYENKKEKSLLSMIQTKENIVRTKYHKQRNELIMLAHNLGKTAKEIANIIGVTERTIQYVIRQQSNEG